MDVRTEARCRQEAQPASEFSYTGFSSAGVWCITVSQVVKTAQSRGRTERTLLFAVALAGRSTASRDRLDPSLLMSHYCLVHPSHRADER
jgi:hypothetical protein